MFLQDTWLWHRWALADPAWATCHDFCHRTMLLQQLSISSPLSTNLPDFNGADEEHSHDQAMRALSTWIKPFLKWLFIPSRPNSTTQGLLQHFRPKELPRPLSGFSYCLLLYSCHTFNKFLTFNAAKAVFYSETPLDLIPDLPFSATPHTTERAGICLQHWDGNEKPRTLWTHIDHETPVLSKHSLWDSPTEASVSIPRIDVCSPR